MSIADELWKEFQNKTRKMDAATQERTLSEVCDRFSDELLLLEDSDESEAEDDDEEEEDYDDDEEDDE